MIDFLTHAGPVARRALFISGLLLFSCALAACGVAGADDSSDDGYLTSFHGTTNLEITTKILPPASSGVSYDAVALQATGAQGTVSWYVDGGTLPPGLQLGSSGVLYGTPSAEGYYTFTARAEDGASADSQELAVSVDTFGVAVVEGLQFGDAWSGKPVTLRCGGFPDQVSFEVVSTDSRGSLQQIDAVAGTATWVPGPDAGPDSVDVIRASCGATGSTADLVLEVAPDPTANHIARFGEGDVWQMDFDVKYGVHAYASDWHAALARLGLRNPASIDRQGSEADNLADLLTRLAVLQELNRVFLRNQDGTSGPQGLAISFPLERPGPGYVAPVAGSTAPAQPNAYNVMAICDLGPGTTLYGMAFGDVVGNGRVENNSRGGAGQLGTFVNYISETVENTFRSHGDALRSNPVSDADLPALKALLYGRAAGGDRADLLHYFADALGRSVAYIAAHEAGHSMGLMHTSTFVSGSIMNSIGIIAPGIEYRFLAEDVAKLRAGLPGPGRLFGSQKLEQEPEQGQIYVCTTCVR